MMVFNVPVAELSLEVKGKANEFGHFKILI